MTPTRINLAAVVLLISCLLVKPITGQDLTQMSEADIAQQRDYIDADLSLLLGDYSSAAEKYTTLYKQDRSNHAAAYGLARAYAAAERIEDAKKYISTAIKLAPDNKWYKLWHANYYRDLGDHANALISYKALYMSEPTDRYFAENYAYSLLETGQDDKAIKVLDEYEQAVGRQELLTKKKWSIYDSQGEKAKALTELVELASANPSNDRLWLNAAKYADQIGDSDVAGMASGKVLALNPLSLEAKRLNNIHEGDESRADEGDLGDLLSDPSVDLDDKILTILPMVTDLSNQKLATEEVDQLDSYTLAIATAHPSSAKALALRADVLMLSNQYEAAVPLYKDAIQIDDSKYSMHSNLLYLLYRLDEGGQLLAAAEAAIDYFPNEVTAYYYYGRALTKKGKYADALSTIKEGSMIAGNNPALKQMLRVAEAYNYLESDKVEEAKAIADDLETNDGWAQELLGDIATTKGQAATAKKHYQKAAKLLNEPRLNQMND
jgi:tetratricopeptide (TPR) repeat protein